MMLTIVVNGEPQIVEPESTVSDLLKQLKMNPKFLAVELNRRVIPRGEHDRVRLVADDQLEIVTLVGGG
jgi:thiamine biosynthesis protein ThiS